MEHGKVTADPVGSRVSMEGVDPGCRGDGCRCSAGKNGGAYVLVGGHVDVLCVCVCVCGGGYAMQRTEQK